MNSICIVLFWISLVTIQFCQLQVLLSASQGDEVSYVDIQGSLMGGIYDEMIKQCVRHFHKKYRKRDLSIKMRHWESRIILCSCRWHQVLLCGTAALALSDDSHNETSAPIDSPCDGLWSKYMSNAFSLQEILTVRETSVGSSFCEGTRNFPKKK